MCLFVWAIINTYGVNIQAYIPKKLPALRCHCNEYGTETFLCALLSLFHRSYFFFNEQKECTTNETPKPHSTCFEKCFVCLFCLFASCLFFNLFLFLCFLFLLFVNLKGSQFNVKRLLQTIEKTKEKIVTNNWMLIVFSEQLHPFFMLINVSSNCPNHVIKQMQ